MTRKNSQARNVMERGLTIQLTKSVTIKPRRWGPSFRMEPKSTFIIIGIIINQTRTAMGTLIWLPWPNSKPRSAWMRPGANWPRTMPATMHSPTHRLRYRSKKFSFFSVALGFDTSGGNRRLTDFIIPLL